MSTILDTIVEQTKADTAKRKRKISRSGFRSFENYERERRNFGAALRKENEVAIIAEIKKASPSKGNIRADFNHIKITEQYQSAGAAAISVLTDEPFFKGKLSYLEDVSSQVDIPVMRKDFIIDPYQVEESRAYGADAILLISTILEGHQLQELHHAAEELDLQCLVECYNERDLEDVDFDQISIIGVNNRDLKTFEVDVHRGIVMLKNCPEHLIKVSESGLSHHEDLAILYSSDIDAALIGEQFMRQENPGEALRLMREEYIKSGSEKKL